MFLINENGCVLNSPLALAYAISVCTAGKSEKIYLAGFDGYELSNPKQSEIENMLRVFKENYDANNLLAITPTKYSLNKTSLFAKKLA